VGPPTETVTPLKIDCYGFFVWQLIGNKSYVFLFAGFKKRKKIQPKTLKLDPPYLKINQFSFWGRWLKMIV